jgi:hypothetical protein
VLRGSRGRLLPADLKSRNVLATVKGISFVRLFYSLDLGCLPKACVLKAGLQDGVLGSGGTFNRSLGPWGDCGTLAPSSSCCLLPFGHGMSGMFCPMLLAPCAASP